MNGERDEVRDRIRALAERAARAAQEAEQRAPPSPPPKHWQEQAENHGEDEPTRLELEAGDVAARSTACARLRALLADGRWHSALELVDHGGLRYGGRLYEIDTGSMASRPSTSRPRPASTGGVRSGTTGPRAHRRGPHRECAGRHICKGHAIRHGSCERGGSLRVPTSAIHR